MTRIAFIGGGNMTTALVAGLTQKNFSPEHIHIVDRNVDKRVRLKKDFGVQVFENLAEACTGCDVIVLAVKPQSFPEMAAGLRKSVALEGRLIISIAAGITVSKLTQLFGKCAIARAMPNTPALIGLGATGLYFNDLANSQQTQFAQDIMSSVGISIRVDDESLLDSVTAISGSGPAYFFLMIEEMIKAGVKMGLSKDEAKRLTLQTALDAASMAHQSKHAPDILRQQVTSPNGTTNAAISYMQDNRYGTLIAGALEACRSRAIELGRLADI